MLNALHARTKINQVTIILHVLLSSLFDFDITAKQDEAKKSLSSLRNKRLRELQKLLKSFFTTRTCSPKEVKVQSRQKQVKISRSVKKKNLEGF